MISRHYHPYQNPFCLRPIMKTSCKKAKLLPSIMNTKSQSLGTHTILANCVHFCAKMMSHKSDNGVSFLILAVICFQFESHQSSDELPGCLACESLIMIQERECSSNETCCHLLDECGTPTKIGANGSSKIIITHRK